jgi:hypothetical protein
MLFFEGLYVPLDGYGCGIMGKHLFECRIQDTGIKAGFLFSSADNSHNTEKSTQDFMPSLHYQGIAVRAKKSPRSTSNAGHLAYDIVVFRRVRGLSTGQSSSKDTLMNMCYLSCDSILLTRTMFNNKVAKS